MHVLEDNKNIIRDQAIRGKCTLVFGYDIWENVFKPIGKDLWNDFIGGVTDVFKPIGKDLWNDFIGGVTETNGMDTLKNWWLILRLVQVTASIISQKLYFFNYWFL